MLLSVSGWYTPTLKIIFSNAIQWYLLVLSQLMISFWLVNTNVANYFFSCNAMVSSNIIPINVNFITIHETGNSSSKIIKKFLDKKYLKHLSSVSEL